MKIAISHDLEAFHVLDLGLDEHNTRSDMLEIRQYQTMKREASASVIDESMKFPTMCA